MKRTVKLLAMVTFMVALASCGMNEVYDPDKNVERTKAQYAKEFEQQFGKIAPNHDWGFGTAATRTANTSTSDWKKNYHLPSAITDDEVNSVKAEFEKENAKEGSLNIDLTNFWIQQVYANPTYFKTTGGNGNKDYKDIASQIMDKMYTYKGSEKDEVIGLAANECPNKGSNGVEDKKRTALMIESGTTKFSYFNSVEEKEYDNNYIVLKIGDAYYVGFDLEFGKIETKKKTYNEVSADGVFTDWILKITPAKKIVDESTAITYEKRIICEDLGATGDFDFNDVVFDALIAGGKTYIKLLAAGGTLPLNVAGEEVHKAFGVSTSTMVGTNGSTVAPVEFVVDWEYPSYNDIPVVVTFENKEAGASVVEKVFELRSDLGEAPQKIAVGTDFEWCKEREGIDEKYPDFPKYVTDPTYSWYRNNQQINTEQ